MFTSFAIALKIKTFYLHCMTITADELKMRNVAAWEIGWKRKHRDYKVKQICAIIMSIFHLVLYNMVGRAFKIGACGSLF